MTHRNVGYFFALPPKLAKCIKVNFFTIFPKTRKMYKSYFFVKVYNN